MPPPQGSAPGAAQRFRGFVCLEHYAKMVRIRFREAHRLAQTVAYGDLGSGDPAPITTASERQVVPVIEEQLHKAGVASAYLLE